MTSALRQHLHLKPIDLEPLVGLADATMERRVREQAPHTPAGAGARVCREPPVVDPIGDPMIPPSNER